MMKPIKTLLTILFISLLSPPSWSETLDDLVKREGIYYQKFTDVPFTGKVTGNEQGSFKNGRKDGAWVSYYQNGQLRYKDNYKNGETEGAWVGYYENGQLWYKKNYKNGKSEGASVGYYENGQLHDKGNFKNDEMEGVWITYNRDRSVFKSFTGTFKNGEKISD
jgi:antitoxin component YwqK of YwqJK toxin-antitoxin module